MAVRFISDTHWNHKNIIAYTSRIDIFTNVNEMNEEMIRRWNSVTAVDDIVYHLGDFAFGSQEVVKKIVSRLNGRIRLILGNHDKRKKPQWYDGLGFDRVYDTPILYKDWFWLSHEPLKYLTSAMPYINIHGHTHDECYANPQRINVSWEILSGYPVLFDELIISFTEIDDYGTASGQFVKDGHKNAAMNYNEGYSVGFIDGRKGNKKRNLGS
jgi:calcineurin-like phosphoesterase family protein